MSDKIFVDGIIAKKPRENAPDFVKGSISIKSKELVEFLRKHTKQDGWINMDLLESKKGSWYLALNTFEPNTEQDPPYSDYQKVYSYDKPGTGFEQERNEINKSLGSMDF